jgi:uncharacterized protein (DUF2235 family)
MKGKNIVLFSDGTGNSSGKLFKTNVWRTYQAVDVADPKTSAETHQIAFYDDGVGTSSFKPLAILGGAAGLGLARNVREIYAFICRNYQPGDKIYAFGFSRGAFTIRVLIDFIMNQGLVPYDGDEAALQRWVRDAYRAYRAKGYHTRFSLMKLLRPLRDALIFVQNKALRQVPYAEIQPIPVPAIQFLGLWDTVDAYGLPFEELTRAIDHYFWPMLLPDLVLDSRVLRARHVLSVNDERNAFHPRLWTEAPEPHGNTQAKHIDDERISQVWFAGVHSDVGGGYPDDGLAYVSLNWMLQEAEKYGLRFCDNMRTQYLALSDENAPMHDSRHGVAGYYRYNPRRIDKLAHHAHSTKTAVEIARVKIHESVLKRIQTGHDGYAPFVLPPQFSVLKYDGCIETAANYVGSQVVSTAFMQQHEHVWNWVWWRRVVYFFTVLATLVLAVMPLTWPALAQGACTSPYCFVSNAIKVTAFFLPAFATTWTDSFASHPEVFMLLVAMVAIGLICGSALDLKVRDSMRSVWYRVPSMNALGRQKTHAVTAPGRLNLTIEWLRTQPAYKAFFHIVSSELVPLVFGIVLVYGAFAVLSQSAFSVHASGGFVCTGSAELKAVESALQPIRWQTSELCKGTGVALQQGATYKLRFTVPSGQPWWDGTVPASPNGIEPSDVTWSMLLGVPFRRHMGQPWFKPMARIHSRGTDVYPLDPKPTVPLSGLTHRVGDVASHETVFETEIVARTQGELFLYVNDAVLFVPFYPDSARWLYNNNHGSAHVRIVKIQAPPSQGQGN